MGQSYRAQLSASDGSGAVSGSWSASGLPEGLNLDSASGLISGTPATAGNFTLTVSFTASDGSGEAQATLSLLVTGEQSQPELTYHGYPAKLTEISGSEIKVMQTLYSYTITDIASLPSVTVSETDLTVEKSYSTAGLELSGFSVGDNVLLVTDESGQLVLVSKLPDSGDQGQGGMGDMSGMGGMSGTMGGASGGSGGTSGQEESYQLYSLEEVSIASVTFQEHMSLEIQVDELDISKISLGQEATISVDALGGEQFEAKVTRMASTGENEGGNSKFTVELTLEKSGDMLPGMSASAFIDLGIESGTLCLPVAALEKSGNQDIIYTGYDEGSGSLSDPVAVITGLSDGEYVQVLSGLEEGQEFYYAYYDTLSVSDEPDFGMTFGGR